MFEYIVSGVLTSNFHLTNTFYKLSRYIGKLKEKSDEQSEQNMKIYKALVEENMKKNRISKKGSKLSHHGIWLP